MPQADLAEIIGSAEAFAATGRIEAALARYDDWLRQRPDDPFAHVVQFNRGVLLTQGNDLAGAAAAFVQAINRDAGFIPPRINLGSIYERLGAPMPPSRNGARWSIACFASDLRA